MPVGRIVVTEDRQHPLHCNAGRVHRREDHRLLLVQRSGRRGLAHENAQLAARVASARSPPFAAVENVFFSAALDARLDVGGVGGGDFGLGHGEARTNRPGQKRLEPALLLLGRAVTHEDFHIPRIGRRAIEDLG